MQNPPRRTRARWVLGVLVTFLVFLAGCLQGSSYRTGRYYPPKPPGAHIDAYLDSEPAVPWEEVGHVSAEGSDWFATLHDVLLVLEDEARGLGADAVIVTEHWVEQDVYVDPYGYTEVRDRVYANGIAIKYR